MRLFEMKTQERVKPVLEISDFKLGFKRICTKNATIVANGRRRFLIFTDTNGRKVSFRIGDGLDIEVMKEDRLLHKKHEVFLAYNRLSGTVCLQRKSKTSIKLEFK